MSADTEEYTMCQPTCHCVQRPSGAMDWTMPPSLVNTKAFAMNINNDMGNMIKMQVCTSKVFWKEQVDRKPS